MYENDEWGERDDDGGVEPVVGKVIGMFETGASYPAI